MTFLNIFSNMFTMKSGNCTPVDHSPDCTSAKTIQTIIITIIFLLLIYFFVTHSCDSSVSI